MGLLADVETLCLTPESGDFEVQTPLHLPRLRTLCVAKCRQPLLAMIGKDTLAGLRTLLVADAAGSLTDILRLGELRGLEDLMIRQQQLEDDAINWICRQETIRSLSLTDTNVSDSVISMLGCKCTLRRLDLFRSAVSFQDKRLCNDVFPAVRSLDVSGTKVSGASVEIIRFVFPQLERLLAHETELAESDIRSIAAWDGLRVLSTDTPGIDFDNHGSDFWDL